ncbi:MAG TPA: methyltransferase domain-containing protein [Tepidisphaeraceae bacterium]|nr:methyltransferase domain-containing protein [Tepidisphaeraceae bacterium]
MDIFWELHTGLAREAPGCDRSTHDALARIVGLPAVPRVLDIGCGPGTQTLLLARQTQGQITAVDTHQPFLDELSHRAAKAGLANRIQGVNVSMKTLGFVDGSFDLLWSEGAIYIMGFAAGLRTWRRLLKPGGVIAVSEISWLAHDIPDEAKRFWAEDYPAMRHVNDNLKIIESAGYSIVSHFVLPENAWWDDYYLPLERRLGELRRKYSDDAKANAVLDATQREINLYRRYSAAYGYVFYIARRSDR